MILPVGVVVILALTTSLANGQETTYPLIDMTEAKPYKETPCPEKCDSLLDTGLDSLSKLLGSFLKTVPFPVNFCQSCQLGGLGDFSFTHKCFMSPGKDVFDHHVRLTFPNMAGECECDFSNNPSVVADTINKGKLIEGNCGKEGYKNTLKCDPIKCEGSQGGDGNTKVNLKVDLSGSDLVGILRVDSSVKPGAAFPIQLSLVTKKPAEITHEAPAKFDESWKCLSGNDKGFTCHMFSNAPAPFFDCLTVADDENIVHKLLYAFGSC